METNYNQSRKDFLKKSATGLVAISAGMLLESFIPKERPLFEIPKIEVVSAKQFRDGVMPRAQLSMLASKIAVEKTSQNNAKEFAGWELMEAIAVIDFLKDLGTSVPPADKGAQDFIAKLKSLEGKAFDIEYMKAEQANHEWLRDLAQNYLDASDAKSTGGETYHLARVAIFAFTEHVGLTKKINSELNG
ncbi:MAG: hypothetical protein C5B52_15050 [Bacteroidetes bacterium]|nr:MAG: hypothetical protein C5B52_15050 [Bacteroidota bacterium]